MHKQRTNSSTSTEFPAEYFTVAELAAYSRIGSNTLYAAIKNRELKHAVVGQKKIIRRKDFENWLKKRTKLALEEFPHIPFDALKRDKLRNGNTRQRSDAS